MQMRIKEVTIPSEFMESEWQTNKVKIRKWNLTIRNEILDQSTEMKSVMGSGKGMTTQVKGGYSQILTVVKCVVEAPWKTGDIVTVGELDPDLGDWLYGEINEFNAGGQKNSPGSAESSKEK